MEQKSAEAIVDKDSTTHGGVVAGILPSFQRTGVGNDW
jgi:hypothetical protein